MNRRNLITGTMLAGVLTAWSVGAAEPAAVAHVTVNPAEVLGPIRLMNSVNGGPSVPPVLGDQKCGNFEDYRALRIPFARTHDCADAVKGGAHACDISAIFPDFDADENDPKNYDFVFTDHFFNAIRRAGTQVYVRLGQTIEHGPKKYGALPPKDFAKWARICEHVIRHYNEGWGWDTDRAYTTVNVPWTNQFRIAYWEIWNEPDLDACENADNLPKGPRCWGGTTTNFFQFYEVAAKHLKAKFPDLRIGGPALCGDERWGDRFLGWCEDRKVPLDFFSWHVYATEPSRLAQKAVRMRSLLDRHGFAKTESILNEWNYVKGWTDDWVYTLEVETGRFVHKAAAFIAAAMVDCQGAPLDHLMFYDARQNGMNSLFDRVTMRPLKGYYPFYAWSKLLDYGTQVKCEVRQGRGKKSTAATGIVYENAIRQIGDEGFRALAAKAADGSLAVLVVRYSEDNNVTDVAEVTLDAPFASAAKVRCHVTDDLRTYTEVPLAAEDGKLRLNMPPNSFAFVEL